MSRSEVASQPLPQTAASALSPRTAPDLGREGFHHVGNSTHWIVFEGVKVLTDPWLSEPADGALVHRLPSLPLPTDPDVVLVSHGHEDHFDPAALAHIRRQAAVVVPGGRLAKGVKPLGFSEVRSAKAGDRLEVRGLSIDVVRGKHSVPELCYRVERNGRAFFFGGDTMLTPEIERLAKSKPVSFAILPAERSTLLGRRYVMTPEEAVGLAKRFGALRAVLTHHEQVVIDRWPHRWMVRIPPPEPAEFPDWFKIPVPGDFIAFPWAPSSEVSS